VRGGIALLILILNIMYRSAACFIPCLLRPLKKSPGRDLKGRKGGRGSKIGLDHLERKKIPLHLQESNYGFSVVEPAT